MEIITKSFNWKSCYQFHCCVHSVAKLKHSRMLLSHFSRVRLCATPWTAAFQAPLFMGFSKQEYWSGVPLPSLHFFLYNPNRCVLQWLIIDLDWGLAMIIYETEEKMQNWFRWCYLCFKSLMVFGIQFFCSF